MRIVSIAFILGITFSFIDSPFYYQQLQYLLSAPVQSRPVELITYEIDGRYPSNSRPKLSHFFNPDCLCSRFNLRHILSLKNKYKKQIDFYAVVISGNKLLDAKELLEEAIPVLVDKEEKLAKACGVYSTPQAAILSSSNQLYFRGNYKGSRYCTDPLSNYV